jgi:hypothetical protein
LHGARRIVDVVCYVAGCLILVSVLAFVAGTYFSNVIGKYRASAVAFVLVSLIATINAASVFSRPVGLAIGLGTGLAAAAIALCLLPARADRSPAGVRSSHPDHADHSGHAHGGSAANRPARRRSARRR